MPEGILMTLLAALLVVTGVDDALLRGPLLSRYAAWGYPTSSPSAR